MNHRVEGSETHGQSVRVQTSHERELELQLTQSLQREQQLRYQLAQQLIASQQSTGMYTRVILCHEI